MKQAPPLDVLPGLLAALLDVDDLVALHGTEEGDPSLFTRRPISPDAGYPATVIGPVIAITDEDGINDYRPVVVIDISTYGEQKVQYRAVEQIAGMVRSRFHGRRDVQVQNYSVTRIRCSGPSPAPVDDAARVGRRVTLTILLYAKP